MWQRAVWVAEIASAEDKMKPHNLWNIYQFEFASATNEAPKFGACPVAHIVLLPSFFTLGVSVVLGLN